MPLTGQAEGMRGHVLTQHWELKACPATNSRHAAAAAIIKGRRHPQRSELKAVAGLQERRGGEMKSMGDGARLPSSLPVVLLLLLPMLPPVKSGCGGGAVLFNFGDSNSDTGGLTAGLGYRFPLPNGRLSFRRSTGRLCDGRLVLDLLCESLNTSYLSPYLDSLGTDFSNGANFAVAGSSTQPRDHPFSLYIQLLQFLRFKSRSMELVAQGSRNLINEEGFKKALYMIDIGQNDLAWASDLSYDQIIGRIPSILAEMKNAIKTIYDNGGKNFWLHGTGPLGCLPQMLSKPRTNNSDLDPYGCRMDLNNAAKEFNTGLSALCDEMSSELTNATIVFTDIYAIKYYLIANSTKYDFESPVMSCCGYGGPPYNYNVNITCSNPGCQVCSAGSRYISWDGVHYTEAANTIVASKILSASYSKPSVRFDFFCNS